MSGLIIDLLQDVPDKSLEPVRASKWMAAAGSFDPERVAMWEALVPKMKTWTAEKLNKNVSKLCNFLSFDEAKVRMVKICVGKLTEKDARWEIPYMLDTLRKLSHDAGKLEVVKAALDTGRFCTVMESGWISIRDCFSFQKSKDTCWQYFMDLGYIEDQYLTKLENKKADEEKRKASVAEKEAKMAKEMVKNLLETGKDKMPFECNRADVNIVVIRGKDGGSIDGIVSWKRGVSIPDGSATIRLGLPPLENGSKISINGVHLSASCVWGTSITMASRHFDCMLGGQVVVRVHTASPTGVTGPDEEEEEEEDGGKKEQGEGVKMMEVEPYYQFPAKIEPMPNPLLAKETQDQFKALLLTEAKFIERYGVILWSRFLEPMQGQTLAQKTVVENLRIFLSDEVRMFTPGDFKTVTQVGPTEYQRRAWGRLADQQERLIYNLLNIFLVTS